MDIKKIDEILIQNDLVQFLELPSFFPTLDLSFSIYKKWTDKRKRIALLKKAITYYIKSRHDIYMSHGYSPTTIQVRKDFAKHKKQGNFAKEKIQRICEKLGYRLAKDNQINKKQFCFIDDTQGENALNKVIKQEREAWYGEWSSQNQDKNADVLFFGKNKYFICEAKHLKETGGGQDKQMNELIGFIKNENYRRRGNVFYIAFLDGIYFNKLKDSTSPKIKKQKEDIIKCLKFPHKKNYFVNTYGLKKLLKHFG